jgi:L-alanine-DL-glutamate epimerase-like enolase superfamily enzyme
MKIRTLKQFTSGCQKSKERADSGQDAVIVRVHTDAGIIDIGEVDSAPLAVQGIILGPYCHTITAGVKHLPVGEDPIHAWVSMA